MMLEALVAAACFAGNNESCLAGLDNYVKYNKIDQLAEELEEQIKVQYPSMHFMGLTTALVAQKKYTFMVYKNVWYQSDFTKQTSNSIIYKRSF